MILTFRESTQKVFLEVGKPEKRGFEAVWGGFDATLHPFSAKNARKCSKMAPFGPKMPPQMPKRSKSSTFRKSTKKLVFEIEFMSLWKGMIPFYGGQKSRQSFSKFCEQLFCCLPLSLHSDKNSAPPSPRWNNVVRSKSLWSNIVHGGRGGEGGEGVHKNLEKDCLGKWEAKNGEECA